MTSNAKDWQQNFIDLVERLASSPEAQIAYLENLDVEVDELALEFESLHVPHRLTFTDRQNDYVREIDRLFSEMSNSSDDGLWSFSGLQSDRRWAKVREIATLLFSSLTEM